MYQCDDCGHQAPFDEMPEAKDLKARLDPDGEATDRECPECGALCYPVERDSCYVLWESGLLEVFDTEESAATDMNTSRARGCGGQFCACIHDAIWQLGCRYGVRFAAEGVDKYALEDFGVRTDMIRQAWRAPMPHQATGVAVSILQTAADEDNFLCIIHGDDEALTVTPVALEELPTWLQNSLSTTVLCLKSLQMVAQVIDDSFRNSPAATVLALRQLETEILKLLGKEKKERRT
jgi:predicted RNA-binding Zn-ribbon protein involved in translation (DUF1610 family)